MIEPEQFDRVAAALPVLRRADAAMQREFRDHAFLTTIPAGRDVFVEGTRVDAIPLLISGGVRVYQIGETGREVTLYRFGPGESCVLTANAILSQQSFPAIATTEQPSEAVMIPAGVFREWVRRYDLWRDFYFELVSQRLASVMAIVDEVAFRRLDARVASFLLSAGQPGTPIRLAHHEIAAELGSSREVVSRILEDLAARGLIRSARRQIEILDLAGLQALAGVT